MITYAASFLMALACAVILTPSVRTLARTYGLVDSATSSRNIHTIPVPRIGGLAIVAAFFAPFVSLLFVDSSVALIFRSENKLILGLILGGVAITGLGLFDDLRGATAKSKLSVQVLVAIALYFCGFKIGSISLPLLGTVPLGPLALPLTVAWIVGVTNAVNLIDGLDGLAGGVALIAVVTNFILALTQGNVILAVMMACLAGSLLGFLLFNFNPASIFMGDTGSMFLGFVLAAVSLITSTKSGTAVSLLVPIIALGLPITDAMLAMARRTLMGRPMFSADKDHIHHQVMRMAASNQRRAVSILYLTATTCAACALWLHWSSERQSTIVVIACVGLLLLGLRKLGFLTSSNLAALADARKRNNALRRASDSILAAVQSSKDPADIWRSICPLIRAVNASDLQLVVGQPSQERFRANPAPVQHSSGSPTIVLLRRLQANGTQLGILRVEWADGRGEVDRDEEIVIDVVALAITQAMSRFALRTAEPTAAVGERASG